MAMKKKTNEMIDIELLDKFQGEFIRKGDYVNSATPVKLFHTLCENEFETRINKLVAGKCTKCCSKKQRTYTELVKEIEEQFNGEFILLSSEEDLKGKKGNLNLNMKADFEHSVCKQTFQQKPIRLLKENLGCTHCKSNNKKTNEIVQKELNKKYGDRFILKSDYTNRRSFVTLLCTHCNHETTDRYFNFITNSRGCTYCSMSYGEQLVTKRLEELGIEYEHNHTYEDCINIHPLRFDFKTSNLIIEYDGIQHFEDVEVFDNSPKENDNIKNQYCLDNGINLLRISYKNINKIDDILTGSTTIEHLNKFDDIMFIENGKVIIKKGLYELVE